MMCGFAESVMSNWWLGSIGLPVELGGGPMSVKHVRMLESSVGVQPIGRGGNFMLDNIAKRIQRKCGRESGNLGQLIQRSNGHSKRLGTEGIAQHIWRKCESGTDGIMNRIARSAEFMPSNIVKHIQKRSGLLLNNTERIIVRRYGLATRDIRRPIANKCETMRNDTAHCIVRRYAFAPMNGGL